MENAGDTGEARGEGERTTGDGRDAEGTYGGGALETDKATNTRTRALRSARKQPKSDTTPRGFDTTRHTDPCHGTWHTPATSECLSDLFGTSRDMTKVHLVRYRACAAP